MNLSVVAGPVAVEVRASDDSGIAEMILAIDDVLVLRREDVDSLLYEWDARPNAAPTVHEIKAFATDTAGLAGGALLQVTVPAAADLDVEPPTVELVRPAEGAAVSGLELVEVRASDDVRVGTVELRIDGVLARQEADTEQFGFAWDTSTAGIGATPVLEARVEDLTGKVATASVSVSVVAEELGPEGAPLAISPISADASPGVAPDSFALSRANGVRVLYWSLSWRDAAKDPVGMASLMGQLRSGGPIAVTLAVVASSAPASYPDPWQSFADPGFAEAFSDFAAAFAAEHRPEYLFVGNEANIYLSNHPDKVDAYNEITRRTREKVAVAAPDTRVGVVIHSPYPATSVVGTLIASMAEPVDLVGYTSYGFDGVAFDLRYDDPPRGIFALEALPALFPDKAFAVVETGWSTSPTFFSDELLQATYLRLLRKHLATSPAEFVGVFLYQDGDTCLEQIDRFIEPGTEPTPEFRALLAELICRFGLRRADGTPKPAWDYLASTTWPAPEPAAGSAALAGALAIAWLARRRRRRA